MNLREDVFAALLAALVLVLVAVAVYVVLQARRASALSWDASLQQLLMVDRYKIALIAADALQAADGEPRQELEPEEIWDLVGGMQGLEALGANCDVLIALACHVQQAYPEALLVAEQLRLNAREIQWHLARLRDSSRAESLHSAFPNYAQRAVATYYVMTQALLRLYEATDETAFNALQRAL